MKLSEITFPKSGEYKSGREFEPIDFFLDVLPSAKRFDLLLGYFSSTAIRTLSIGFAYFLYNGGRLRMVTNHIYSSFDKNALIEGKSRDPEYFNFSLDDYEKLKESLDGYGKHFFNCLAWLIAKQRVEIKIIKPRTKGISHIKSGLFVDEDSKVKFMGSMNFTSFGLLQNLELISINKSFESERDRIAITEFESEFKALIEEKNTTVDYLEFNSIEEVILSDFGDMKIHELLYQEKKLISNNVTLSNRRRKKKITDLEEEIERLISLPKFPYDKPRDYQIAACDNWIKNGMNGIFAMATGTGKTLTSLNCLLRIFKTENHYRAIITVPTIALANQWEDECRKFNFQNIIKVSSRNKWKDELAVFNSASNYLNNSYIIIVTYASFVKKKFQSFFKKLPSNMLFIADEAHNIGSKGVSKLLPQIHLNRRIGLSATIHRQYDDDGNHKIEEFFKDCSPYSFEYSMKLAIENEYLCRYEYYPHVIELTELEMNRYYEISKKLMKYFDPKTKSFKKDKKVEKLLMDRKRIIHKAENKFDVYKQILKNEFEIRKGLKYTLIYVPEGSIPDYDKVDSNEESEQNLRLINQYTRAVSDLDDELNVNQFTAKTEDREKVLKKFADGKIDALVSMKCLDEGVDVPRSELAVFCSSTGNPRQFIQRRGRVLRIHDNKTFATIHDLVVVPSKSNGENSYFQMNKSLIKKELERVANFAILSMNSVYSFNTLSHILEEYNINLYDLNEK